MLFTQSPIWPYETAAADIPGAATVKALVVGVSFLDNMQATSWALAAPVQPVTIGIQAVLDVVITNSHPVF